MVGKIKSQKGFTLIEVVAAAALIGILATMLMPSLSGANDRVKNAKLSNDLATIDQAIQLYRMDTGKVPSDLTSLDSSYLGGKLEFKDAAGDELVYTADGNGSDYSLTGKNSSGSVVKSPASKDSVQAPSES
ncbi:MAG: prepilin-type N-terminal cleavage/methylation domain-containing protein [Phascolarctobacterium sp.]|nr:prepilin-type N-terminal cleavage/methylation domain-containing protein [Phascolarctobacterium sp.]